MEEVKQFIQAVKKMREAQKGYFRTPRYKGDLKQQYMKEARHYETLVDRILEGKNSNQKKLDI